MVNSTDWFSLAINNINFHFRFFRWISRSIHDVRRPYWGIVNSSNSISISKTFSSSDERCKYFFIDFKLKWMNFVYFENSQVLVMKKSWIWPRSLTFFSSLLLHRSKKKILLLWLCAMFFYSLTFCLIYLICWYIKIHDNDLILVFFY